MARKTLQETAAQRWWYLSMRQAAKGMKKYGEPLDSATGRDWIDEAQQELVDAFMYLEKARLERGKQAGG